MGEILSKSYPNLFTNANPLIQGYLAQKPQVTPYREGTIKPTEF